MIPFLKKYLPFSCLPSAWGLEGKARERAEAEYNYQGEELARKLVHLSEKNDTEKALAMLDIDLQYHKIDQYAYEKQKATLLHEPYVRIVDITMEKDQPSVGSIELDWNDYFVSSLHDAGYVSVTDEGVIDIWLTELCKNIATEQYGGVGEFDSLADENLSRRQQNDVIKRKSDKS